MDPNVTLATIRENVNAILEDEEEDIMALCEAFEVLDLWLSQGGFLPASWTK